ncbi:non-heme iron oxygenase ferredoxin subunit, partial [bacterium]|nr:non-heme iron oxygenase ferredoxin subunit [bacterium]
PHRGGPLGEGTCQGTQVTCPWHGARFDLTTGACVSSSQISRVKTFSVTIQDPQIWVSNP